MVTDNAMSAERNVSEPLDVDAFSREVFELIVNAHRCILCWRTNPKRKGKMSNRTLVELNHDCCPREEELLEWAKAMRNYMSSGDKRKLPNGVTFKHMRHHSEPDPMEEK
jgi:hypothetical protein